MSSCNTIFVQEKLKDIEEIERSIIKKYRKEIYSPFIRAIKDYKMIEEGDKIAVCISGGKDSLLLAKCLEILNRYSEVNFSLVFIAMNPGFNEKNYQLLVDNCRALKIDVEIFDTDVFAVAQKISSNYPCYLCAKRRRGALYNKAEELGCNKIALGHHYDDIIETIMLNLLYGGCYGSMLPRLKADNYKGMELIRPLAYVREKDIIRYTHNAGIQPMNCGCTVTAKKTSSKRSRVKKLLNDLRQEDELIDRSIFASAKNVHLDTVEGYKKEGQYHQFMERFDKNE